MVNNILYALEVFILVFCILNVLKHIFNVIKVMRLKEGKIESTTSSNICLGLSISYIITALIIGF